METPKDKRVKREIANSNERRRMQSINAGFQKLKRLLPVNHCEKLSKAAILKHAADFIQQIEREKLVIHEQNTLLRSTLLELKGGTTDLDTIDLDALPTIPLQTRITLSTNDISSTDNSNDTQQAQPQHQPESRSEFQKEHQLEPQSERQRPRQQQQQQQQQPPSQAQQHNNKNGNKEVISDRVTSPNGFVSTGAAKAAIALPLEVPYTSEAAAIRHHELHPPPTKMVKTETNAIDPQDPAPKGQNLDTICKAIMEIEGDSVFINENIKHETT